MKTKHLFIVLMIPTLFFSCKTSKKITKVNDSTIIEIPLSGKEFQNDRNYFRAKQSGNSPDLSTSKKIALQNAKAELAGSINTLVKGVTEQYTNQRTLANRQEFENMFEENIRTVINQELNDVKIIGEQVLKETNGSYTYWIAIEVSKKSIQDNIEKQIFNQERHQLDLDKQRFMEIFDREMEKLEQ